MADKIDAILRLRRGTDGERRNIILQSGEIAFSTDVKRVFIGDGTTRGGFYVGNETYVGSNPDSSAIINDLYYNTTSSIMYILTSESGPDNIRNYARVSPISDNTTLKYINGVFSVNLDPFNNPSTGYLRMSGGTMGGYITLHANPINTYHAATKGYTDNLVNTASSVLNNKISNNFVHISGDTMSGFITLHAHPQNPYHAATKSYTDSLVTGRTGIITNSILTNYVHISGETMTGYLTLNAPPVNTYHAATKGWVDLQINTLRTEGANRYVHLSGDTITGDITIQQKLQVDGTTKLNGVDFNNKSISKFVVNVNNTISLNSTTDTYVISPNDNGSVLYVYSTSPCYVAVPKGLPLGFNLLIVRNSSYTLSIKSAVNVLPVQIVNVYGSMSIGNRYGVCNMIIVDTDKALISGDLS